MGTPHRLRCICWARDADHENPSTEARGSPHPGSPGTWAPGQVGTSGGAHNAPPPEIGLGHTLGQVGLQFNQE